MNISALFRLRRRKLRPGTALALIATLAATLGFSVGHAQLIVIVNTGAALGTGTSWTPVGVPTAGSSAVWNSTSTATTGADTIATTLSLGNIDITNATKDITISGGALTLGNLAIIANITTPAFSGNTIDMSLATANVTIASPLTLVGNQTWNVYSLSTTTYNSTTNVATTVNNQVLTLNITAPITGSRGFTETGNGTINLNASSPGLLGTITVVSGNLNLNAPNGDTIGPAAFTPSSPSVLSTQLVLVGAAVNNNNIGQGSVSLASANPLYPSWDSPNGAETLMSSGGNIGVAAGLTAVINTPVILTSNQPLGITNTGLTTIANSDNFLFNFAGPGSTIINGPVILSGNFMGDSGNFYLDAPGTNALAGTGGLTINSYIMPGALSVGNGTTLPSEGDGMGMIGGNVTINGMVDARAANGFRYNIFGNLTLGNGAILEASGPTIAGADSQVSDGTLNMIGNSVLTNSNYAPMGAAAFSTPDIALGYGSAGTTTINLGSGFLFLQIIEMGSTQYNTVNFNQNGGIFIMDAGGSGTAVGNNDSGLTFGDFNNQATATATAQLAPSVAPGASDTGIVNTYNFNGGLLEMDDIGFFAVSGNATFRMNGGTFRPGLVNGSTAASQNYFFVFGAANDSLLDEKGGAIFDSAASSIAWGNAYQGGNSGGQGGNGGTYATGANFLNYPTTYTYFSPFINNMAIQHDPALGSALDGGVSKLGLGNLTWSGMVNTYNGPTTIVSGNLVLNFQGLPFTNLFNPNASSSSNVDQYQNSYANPSLTGYTAAHPAPISAYLNANVMANPLNNIIDDTSQLVMGSGALIMSGNTTQQAFSGTGTLSGTIVQFPIANIQAFPGTTLAGNATMQAIQFGNNTVELNLGYVTRNTGSSLFLKSTSQALGFFSVDVPSADLVTQTINGISLPASTGQILTSNNLLTGTPYATSSNSNGDDWAALATTANPDGSLTIIPLSTLNTGVGGADSTTGNSPGYHVTTPTTLGGAGTLYANPNADMTSAAGQINPAGNPVARTILQANETLSSLRFLTSQSSVVNLNGDTLAIGGILYATDFGAVGGGISNGFIEGPPGGDVIIIQNDAAPQTISATILNNPVTVGGVTTGSGLTKAGGGQLILNTNVNTYTGYTTLDAGTLVLNGSSTLATGIQLNGGALSFNNPSVLGGGIMNLSGGSLINNNGSSFTLNLSQINMANNFSLTGPGGPNATTATITTPANAPITLTGNVTMNIGPGQNLAVTPATINAGANNALVLNGNISGTGIIDTSGTGNLALNGNNINWTGGAAFQDGNISFGSPTALGTGIVIFGTTNGNGGGPPRDAPSLNNDSGSNLTLTTNNAMIFAGASLTYIGNNTLDMGSGPLENMANQFFSNDQNQVFAMTLNVTNPTGVLEFDGPIGGANQIGGNLTVNGEGTLVLTNAVDMTSSFQGLHLNVTGGATLMLNGDAYLDTATMFTNGSALNVNNATIFASLVAGGTNVIGANIGDNASVILNNNATWIAQMTQPVTNGAGGGSTSGSPGLVDVTNVNGIEIGANQYNYGNGESSPPGGSTATFAIPQGGWIQGTLILNDSSNVTTNELFVAQGFGPLISNTAGAVFTAAGVLASGGYNVNNPLGTITQQDRAYGTVILNGGTLTVDNYNTNGAAINSSTGVVGPVQALIYPNGPTQPISNIFLGGINDNNGISTGTGGNVTNYTRFALLELNGGTLKTYGIYANDTGAGYAATTINGVTEPPYIAGNATVLFNGGTLTALANNPLFVYGNVTQVTTSTLNPNASAILNLVIGAGGAVINTNGFNIGIPLGFTHDTLDLGSLPDGGLIVTGGGNLTLGGGLGAVSTYTGPTNIQSGTLIYNTGSVAVSGAAVTLPGQITGSGNITTAGVNLLDIDGAGGSNFTGTLQLNSGTVELDFSAGATSSLLGGVASNGQIGASLLLNGGTLQINGGSAAAVQNFFSTTVTGPSILQITNNPTTNGAVKVNLGTITDSVSTIIDFNNSSTNAASGFTFTSNTNSLVGALANASGTPFATVNGGADWAGIGTGTTALGITTYPVVALSSLAGVAGNPAHYLQVQGANSIVANDNIYIGGAYNSASTLGAGTGGVTAIPTLTINATSAAGATFNLGGHTLAVGGLLLSSGVTAAFGTYTFTNGTLEAQQPGGTLLYAVYGSGGSGDLVLNSTLANNGATASNLNKVGTGLLELGAANTYTGTTSISGGTLQLDNLNALANSLLILNGGSGSLQYQSAINFASNFATDFSIGGLAGAGGATTINGVLGLVLPSSYFTLSPVAGVSGNFTGVLIDSASGPTNVQMNGAATSTEILTQGQHFTGNLLVSQGNLILQANEINMSNSVSTNITVNGGSLTINGTNPFAGAFIVNGGTLDLSNPDALGTPLAGYLTGASNFQTVGTGTGGSGAGAGQKILFPTSQFTINGGFIDNTSGGNLALDTVPLAINGSFTFIGTGNLNTQNGTAVATTTIANITAPETTTTTATTGVPTPGTITINVNANTLTLSNRLSSAYNNTNTANSTVTYIPNVTLGTATGTGLTLGTPINIAVAGAGTLFISGNNANLTTVNNTTGTGLVSTFATAALYSRWVVSNGGTLEISQDASLGIVPNSTISNGLFAITAGAAPDAANIILNGGTLESSTALTLNSYRGLELGGATLGSGGNINTSGGSISYGGNITGLNDLAALTKTGGNALNLTSNLTANGIGVNSFTGNIFLVAGTLTVAGDDALGPTDDPANTATLQALYGTGKPGTIQTGPLAGIPNGGQIFFVGNSTLQFAGGTATQNTGNIGMQTGRNIYITDESANTTSTIPLVAVIDSTAGNVAITTNISGGQNGAGAFLTTNGILQKNGVGILNLTGNNVNLQGGFNDTAGIVQIGSAVAVSGGNGTFALGTGNLTFSGGGLDNVTGQALNLGLTTNNPIFLNGTLTYFGGYSGINATTTQVAGTNGDLNLGTNTVTMNASRTISVGVTGELGTPTLTINGPIVQNNNTNGNYTLTKSGPGNLSLTGINTFAGGISVTGGNLSLSGQDLSYTGNTTISQGADLILDFHGGSALPTGIINSASIVQTVAGANLQVFGGNLTSGTTFNQAFQQVFLAGTDSFTVVQDAANPNSLVTLTLGSITRNPASILNVTSVSSGTGTGAALVNTTSGTAGALFVDPVTNAPYVTFNLTDFAIKNLASSSDPSGVGPLPATTYLTNNATLINTGVSFNAVSTLATATHTTTGSASTAVLADINAGNLTGTAHGTDILNFNVLSGGGTTTLTTSGTVYTVAAMKFAQPASNSNVLSLNGNVLATNGIMATNQVGLTTAAGVPTILGSAAGSGLEANYVGSIGGELELINYGATPLSSDPLYIQTPIQNFNNSAATPTNLTIAGTGNIYLTVASPFTGNVAVGGGNLVLSSGATTTALGLQNAVVNYNNLGGSIIFDGGHQNGFNGGQAITAATFGGLEGTQGLVLENMALSSVTGVPGGAPVALTIGGGTLTQSTTYSGVLSGNGSLVMAGGTFNLIGTDTYSGGTVVNGGTLILGATPANPAGQQGGSFGGNATVTAFTTLNGGTLILNTAGALSAATAGTALPTGNLTINGGSFDSQQGNTLNSVVQKWNATVTFLGTSNLNMGTGQVWMSANETVDVGVFTNPLNNANTTATLTVGGNITGTGPGFILTKDGPGILSLTNTGATVANSITGMIIKDGQVNITGDNNLGIAPTVHTAPGTNNVNDTASIGDILLTGGSTFESSVPAPVTLNANTTFTINPFRNILIGPNGAYLSAASGITLTFNGEIDAGTGTGSSLGKTGAGTVLLTNNGTSGNDSLGQTILAAGVYVNAGTLALTGGNSTGAATFISPAGTGAIYVDGGTLNLGNTTLAGGSYNPSNGIVTSVVSSATAQAAVATDIEGTTGSNGNLTDTTFSTDVAALVAKGNTLAQAQAAVAADIMGTTGFNGNLTDATFTTDVSNIIANGVVGINPRTATNSVVLFNPIEVMANSTLNSTGNSTIMGTISGPRGLVLTVALNGANAVGGTNQLNIGPTTFTGGSYGGNLSIAQFNTDVSALVAATANTQSQAAAAVEADIIAGNLTDAAATAFRTNANNLIALGNSPAEANAAIFIDVAGVSGYNGNVLFTYTHTGGTIFTSAVLQVANTAGVGTFSSAGASSAIFDFSSLGTATQGYLFVSSNVTAATISGNIATTLYTTAPQALVSPLIATQPAGGGQVLTFNMGALQNGTDGRTYLTSNTSNTTIATGNTTTPGVTSPVFTGVSTAPGTANSYQFNTDYVVGALGLNTTFAGDFADTGVAGDQVFLTKVGNGTLILTGNSSSTGLVTINAGTLQLGNGGNTGNLSMIGTTTATTAPIAILSGATLDIFRGDNLVTIPNNIVGTGTIRVEGIGTTTLTNPTSTFAGTLNLNAGTLLEPSLANGGTASYLGASSNAAANLVIVNGATLEIAATAPTGTDRNFTMGNQTDGGGARLSSNGTAAVSFTGPAGGAVVVNGGSGLPQTLTLTGNNAGLGGGTAVGAGVVNVFGLGLANDTGSVAAPSTTGLISLLVTGNATWAVTGNYTNTGNMAAGNGGLLLVNSPLAGAPLVALSGGTVGSGLTNSPAITTAIINSGGALAPDYIAGTNSFNIGNISIGSGGLTLGGGNLVSEFLLNGSQYSQVNITGGGKLVFTAASGIDLYQTGTLNAFSEFGTYTLATTGGITLIGGAAVTAGGTIPTADLTVADPALGFGYAFSMNASDALLLSISFAPAANDFQGTGTANTSGTAGQVNWKDASTSNNIANWTTPSSGLNYPTGAGSVVLFPNHLAVATTITDNVLNSANGGIGITLGGMIFDSSLPYTIAGSSFAGIALSNNTSAAPTAPTTVTLSNSALGSNAITAPLLLTNSPVAVTVIAPSTLTLSGPISPDNGGTGGLTIGSIGAGTSGTLLLSGTNTFTGGVTFDSGTLDINSGSALGTGRFIINGGNIDDTGGGGVAVGTANAVTINNGNLTYVGATKNSLSLGTGAVLLGANTTVNVGTGSTLTLGGLVSSANVSTITLAGKAYTTAAFGLTMNGAGNLVLSSGGNISNLTVNGGDLVLGSGAVLHPNSSVAGQAGTLPILPQVLVNNGTIDLGGANQVLGNITLNSGNIIDGTITINDTHPVTTGNFTLVSGVVTASLAGNATVFLDNSGPNPLIFAPVNGNPNLTGLINIQGGNIGIQSNNPFGSATINISGNSVVLSNNSGGNVSVSTVTGETWTFNEANGGIFYDGTNALNLGPGSIVVNGGEANITVTTGTLTLSGPVTSGALSGMEVLINGAGQVNGVSGGGSLVIANLVNAQSGLGGQHVAVGLGSPTVDIISGGTLTANTTSSGAGSSARIALGEFADDNVVVNLTGNGTLDAVGFDASTGVNLAELSGGGGIVQSTLNIGNTSVVTATALTLGYGRTGGAATTSDLVVATVNQTGGTVQLNGINESIAQINANPDAANLFLGSPFTVNMPVTATYNLNGGLLSVSGIYADNTGVGATSVPYINHGSAVFNFNGGILQGNATDSAFIDANWSTAGIVTTVGPGGAIIDAENSQSGFTTLVVSGNLVHGGGGVDGGLTKFGPGILALVSNATTGSTADIDPTTALEDAPALSTYTGPTTIEAGTIQVNVLGNAGQPGPLGESGKLILNGGTLQYGGTLFGTVLAAPAAASNLLIQLGNATASLGGTIDASGTGALTLGNPAPISFGSTGGAGAAAQTLTLTGYGGGAAGANGTPNSPNVLAAAIVDNGAFPTAVQFTGTGAWQLTGASTYTGATTVNSGTLLVSGSLTGTSVTLPSNSFGAAVGTLGGNGTIGGLVTVGSSATDTSLPVIIPGLAGTGTLTVQRLSLAGANLDYYFNGNNTLANLINVTAAGGLALGTDSFSLFSLADGTKFIGLGNYTLIDYSGNLTGGVSALTVANPQSGHGYTFEALPGSINLLITGAALPYSWNVGAGGIWSTDGNWSQISGVAQAPVNNQSVLVNLDQIGASPITITINGTASTAHPSGTAVDIGALNIDSTNPYTVAATGANTLTFDNSANVSLDANDYIGGFFANGANIGGVAVPFIYVAHGSDTISAPIVMTQGLLVDVDGAGDTLTLGGAISQAGATALQLAANGTGTLILGGSNTYAGVTTLFSGTLNLAGSLAGGLSYNGGTLAINSNSGLGTGALTINTTTAVIANTSGQAVAVNTRAPILLQNDNVIATDTIATAPVTSVADAVTFSGPGALDLGTGGILINSTATSANFTINPGVTVTFNGTINTANLTYQGVASTVGSGMVVQFTGNGTTDNPGIVNIQSTVNAASGTPGANGQSSINAAHVVVGGNISLNVLSGGNIDATNSNAGTGNQGGLIVGDQPFDNSTLSLSGNAILSAGRNINSGLGGTNLSSGLELSAVYNGTIAQNQATYNAVISSTFNVAGSANVTLQELMVGKGKSTGLDWGPTISAANEATLLVGPNDAIYATVNQTGGNVTVFGTGGPNGADLILGGAGSYNEPNFTTYNLGSGAGSTALLSTQGIFATNTGSNQTAGNSTIAAVNFTAGVGNATFNFNGGTLRALGNNPTFISADSSQGTAGLLITNIAAGGADIDTNGFSIGIQSNLNHGGTGVDGGLTVTSSAGGAGGTLTLAGTTNNYTGPTSVTNSILVDLGTISASPITINQGGLLTGTGSASGAGAVVGGGVTVNSGGSLGSTGGGLTVNGPVVVNAGGNITGLVTLGAAAPLTVRTGGILNGTGVYNGGASVSGTINSGSTTSIGQQSFSALTLSGATINDKISANDGQNDLLVVTGSGGLDISALNAASFNFLTPAGSPFLQNETDIPLIEYSGALTGSLGDLGVGNAQTGWSYSFLTVASGGQEFIEANITTQLREYEWNAPGSFAVSAVWGTVADWSQFSTPAGYDATLPPNAIGLGVFFPDTPGAPQSTAITLDNNYTVGALNFSSQQPYTIAAQAGRGLTLDGGPGVAAALNVTAGNPTLSTPVIVNADGGGLVVGVSSGSTLAISGAVSQAGGVAGLAFNGTGSTGTQSTGTLVLSGSNTYGGATTLGTVGVPGGTLDLNSSTAIGTGALVINGGSLDNTSGAAITLATNNVQFWSGNFTFNGSNPLNLGTGAVTVGNSPVITVATPSGNTTPGLLVVGGNLQGASNLIKQGSGTLVLGGISNLVGNTQVQNGNLTLASGANNRLPAATVLTLGGAGGGAAPAANGFLVLGDGNGILSVTVAGLTTGVVGAGGGSLTGSSGGGAVLGGNALASTLTINLPAGATDTFSGLLGNYLAPGTDPQNGLAVVVNGGAGSILNLSNVAGESNAYAGGTTVNSGTLQAGGDAALGLDNSDAATALNLGAATFEATGSSTSNRWFFLNNAASAIVVDNGQTLTLGSNSGLKGAGSLNFSGPGTLVLAGALVNGLAANYTYAGATNINSGTLQLGLTTGAAGSAPASLLPATSVVTVGAAATLNLNDNNITVPEISGAGAIIMSSLDAINNYSVNGGSGGGTGNITTGSNNVNATLSGGISGLGSIIKVGTGSLTLSGNNSYFGNTTVSAGTLVVGNVTALQDSDLIVASNGGAVTFSGTLAGVALGALTGNGTLVVSNGTGGNFTLTVGGSNASFEFDGILSGVNGFLNKVGPGTFTIANSETYAGNTTVSGGILQLGNGQTNGAVAGPIVNAGGTVQFQNATSQTYGGVISGGGGVTLNGSPTATVTLGGFSTYTGPTNLNSGTLVVNGGLAATGSIFVSGSNNATLGGNAVVGSVNVQGGGVIAPGVANAPGTKTTAGVFSTLTVNNLTLQSNASTFYPFHLSTFATGSKNSASDTIVVDGILTDTSIGTQYLFNFQDTGYFSGGSPTVYTLISLNNSGGADTFTSAGFSSADFAYENLGLNPAGGQLVGSFQFSTNGRALDFVVVPEPSTWGLLLGAAALLAAARRRRSRR